MKLTELIAGTRLTEDDTMSHVLTARDIIHSDDGVAYQKFLTKLRDKYGEDYSSEVHKEVQKAEKRNNA